MNAFFLARLPVILLAAGFLTLAGCSQKSDSTAQAAAINSSFDSASPELKQHWDAAHAAAAKNDFSGAITHLLALADDSAKLAPEQATALRQFWSDFGTQAFQAASTGDKAAADALKQMKASKFGNPDGR
jgi:hypothetical protein